ncbi:TPA: helix-turn-helix domain-containing protein [Proteus mirabilis]|uniref:helix-turn-helix domain-containing protein n=1 Tax=Proteus mirabilis TaxID=584 RepID=UPI001F03370F|nr:helix-turn-helix domain-containing protein [Proteus mirabilis]ELI8996617.1 helix-turn-helix domain-containing protein [Proteus mirabilis]
MSMILMAKAMQLKVGNPSRKLVLIKLADNANDKGECFPSYQHVADQCEISRRSVINHIDALCEQGLVRKVYRSGEKGNSSNVYKLNLDDPIQESPSEKSALGMVKDLHHPSEKSAPPPSEKSAPRTSHSFEPVNEPKKKGFDAKKEPIPDWLDREIWFNWIDYRNEIKKPFKTKKTFELQVKFLLECLEEGYSPEEIINQSITNGWQGLFKPKNNHQAITSQQGSWNTPEAWRDFI